MLNANADYARVYHLTSLKHAKSNIQRQRLKVTMFSEANDPFEVMALNCRGSGKRQARAVLREFKEAQDDETGLLSFSRSWSNPVLWSHYADKHRGVCLGFDVKAELLEEVKYADDLLRMRISDDQETPVIPEELQELLMVTKYRHWGYEDEVRRFVPMTNAIREGDMFFWPFDANMLLREVIFGPRCPGSEVDGARKLLASAGVDAAVSKARLGFGSFEVIPNRRYPPT